MSMARGWPPEMETLDQLLGGPVPLSVIRRVFEDDDHFRVAVFAMLQAKDVKLSRAEETAIQSWKWMDVLNEPDDWLSYDLSLTASGMKRIA
jgi:hypothetical protein